MEVSDAIIKSNAISSPFILQGMQSHISLIGQKISNFQISSAHLITNQRSYRNSARGPRILRTSQPWGDQSEELCAIHFFSLPSEYPVEAFAIAFNTLVSNETFFRLFAICLFATPRQTHSKDIRINPKSMPRVRMLVTSPQVYNNQLMIFKYPWYSLIHEFYQ